MLVRAILLSVLSIGMSLISAEHNNACEFVIIIPSYNNEKYCEENLDSVCWQNSTYPYQIIYINDRSADRTGELVDNYIKTSNLEHRVKVIHNEERLGSGIANIYNAIHNFVDDNKIVVIVDGDDLLPHNDVLMTLESYYQNPDVWMTHSMLKYIPTEYVEGEKVPDWIYQENKLRKKTEWVSMLALRTFRAALFKKINKSDLFYNDKFMTVSWDVAFCIPMIEMCASPSSIGYSHYAFIDEVLYYYRIDTPINDYKTKKKQQIEVEAYIRNLPPYLPISSLSQNSEYQQNA